MSLGPSLKDLRGTEPKLFAENKQEVVGTGKLGADSFEKTLDVKLDKKVEHPSDVNRKEVSSTSTKLQEKVDAKPARPEKKETVKDTQSVKAENSKGKQPEKAEKTVEKSSVKSVGRLQKNQQQQAMQEFMDSMESELGIPPEDILGAMAMLKPEDLEKSPELTASQVIKNLDLDPKDQEKAQALYMQMLSDMNSLQPTPQFFLVPKGAKLAEDSLNSAGTESVKSGLEIRQSATASKDGLQSLNAKERRAMLNESLDRLNQRFFLNHTSEEPMMEELKPSSQPIDINQLQMLNEQNQYLDQSDKLGVDTQNFEDVINPDTGFQDSVTNTASSGKMALDGLDEVQKQQLSEKLSALALAAEGLQKSGPNVSAKSLGAKELAAKSGNESMDITSDSGLNWLRNQLNVSPSDSSGTSPGSFDQGGSNQEFDEESFSGDSKGQIDSFSKAHPMNHKSEGGFALASGAAAGSQAANSVDRKEAIQKVMDQTQFLVKKGGGEATIELNEQGLGKIQMKVIVHEGKVNVQMATDNKETKKLIENSIGDLKQSLSGHKLVMDHMKVDVNNQSQDSMNNGNFDQNREQARQFLGQFREDNLNSRDQFFDQRKSTSFSSNGKTEALTPSSDTARAKSRYLSQGKGAGLDLVA